MNLKFSLVDIVWPRGNGDGDTVVPFGSPNADGEARLCEHDVYKFSRIIAFLLASTAAGVPDGAVELRLRPRQEAGPRN